MAASYRSNPAKHSRGSLTLAVATLIFARENLGMGQREVAQEMGVGAGTVAEMETLKRSPSWELISRYADAVGLKAAVVLHDKED